MATTVVPRPAGVTILAVVGAIGGVLVLLAGLALFGLLGALAAGGAGIVPSPILGVVSLAQGVLLLLFAFGAWRLRDWAWMVGVASSVLGVALAVLFLVNRSEIPSQIVSLAVNGAILLYLNTRAVKQAFGRA